MDVPPILMGFAPGRNRAARYCRHSVNSATKAKIHPEWRRCAGNTYGVGMAKNLVVIGAGQAPGRYRQPLRPRDFPLG